MLSLQKLTNIIKLRFPKVAHCQKPPRNSWSGRTDGHLLLQAVCESPTGIRRLQSIICVRARVCAPVCVCVFGNRPLRPHLARGGALRATRTSRTSSFHILVRCRVTVKHQQKKTVLKSASCSDFPASRVCSCLSSHFCFAKFGKLRCSVVI